MTDIRNPSDLMINRGKSASGPTTYQHDSDRLPSVSDITHARVRIVVITVGKPMAVYVDSLESWGWVIRGRVVQNCHMFTDSIDLADLHDLALRIGMRLSWFQANRVAPDYDLTASRRAVAVQLGAIQVGRREAVEIWRARRAAAAACQDEQ